MTEDIMPAVNLPGQMPNQMSADEFQKRLQGWFEERGLLAELRAHLRKQMIGVLSETAIGGISVQQRQTVSPKLQALNLLVAEFLLDQDYHYSLSVFSTEVPLINVLPELSGTSANLCSDKNRSKKWQFSEKDLIDILQTLGVTENMEEGYNIYDSYYNGAVKESLLMCIMRLLNTVQNKSQNNLLQTNELKSSDLDKAWVRRICEILAFNRINSQSIKDVLNIVINVVNKEKKNIEKTAQKNSAKLRLQLQTQLTKNDDIKKQLLSLKDSLEIEKAKLQNDNKQRQQEVLNFEAKIQKNQGILKDRYQQLIAREKTLLEKASKLEEKEDFLKDRERQLQSEFDSLRTEQKTIIDLQTRLQDELKEKHETAKNDAEFLDNLKAECKNMQNQIITTQEALVNVNEKPTVTDQHTQELIEQLKIENVSLKSLNSEQKLKIEELANKASTLMRDLETTQTVVNILTNNHQLNKVTLSASPLAAPTTLTLQRNKNHLYGSNGGGEDGSLRAINVTPKIFKNLSNSASSKQETTNHKSAVPSSNSSDDCSPTTDVLKEARERLKRLEEESEEVDRQYKEFRIKRAEQGHPLMRQFHNLPFGNATWISDINKEFESSLQHNKPMAHLGKHKVGNMIDVATAVTSPNNFANIFCCNGQPEESTAKVTKENVGVSTEDECSHNQSISSSGIMEELLAVGTSGVSISGIDTTDEKSTPSRISHTTIN